jgi:hypothetical protein
VAITDTSTVKGSRTSTVAWLLVIVGLICFAILGGRRLKTWSVPRTVPRRHP